MQYIFKVRSTKNKLSCTTNSESLSHFLSGWSGWLSLSSVADATWTINVRVTAKDGRLGSSVSYLICIRISCGLSIDHSFIVRRITRLKRKKHTSYLPFPSYWLTYYSCLLKITSPLLDKGPQLYVLILFCTCIHKAVVFEDKLLLRGVNVNK